MSDVTAFTSVAVVGAGLSAFVATCHDGPVVLRRVSGKSRAESKGADLEHGEVRASRAKAVSWWGMRRSKPPVAESGKSAPSRCTWASKEEPPVTRGQSDPVSRGRSDHVVGARQRSKAPPIETRESRSGSHESTSVRNMQQAVQPERVEVNPFLREYPGVRSCSRASTVSLPSNPSPEPFQRAASKASTPSPSAMRRASHLNSTASTPSPVAMRRASTHLTSAMAVPLTPAATLQRPDTLTTQRLFLEAASKLSDEELRDFVADFISTEIAAINRLPPELRGPAYRSLCIAWHPDKCPAIASIATNVFQHLQAQKNKIR